MQPSLNALESALVRDRGIAVASLLAVCVLAWAYILSGAGTDIGAMPAASGMDASSGGGMAMTPDWTPGYVALMLVMWWVMMVAMMLPSAAPMILTFAALKRKGHGARGARLPTAAFAAGYLLAWGGFSVAAVGLQWALEEVRLLSPMMAATSLWLGGGLLIAAGVYQLTPLKHACLQHCRAPVFFLSRHWRPGPLGPLRMGLHHGLFCLGCCWVLMGLLFYGGAMNLWWIIGLTLYVLVEKLAPRGGRIGALAGLLLVGWGLWVLWQASGPATA